MTSPSPAPARSPSPLPPVNQQALQRAIHPPEPIAPSSKVVVIATQSLPRSFSEQKRPLSPPPISSLEPPLIQEEAPAPHPYNPGPCGKVTEAVVGAVCSTLGLGWRWVARPVLAKAWEYAEEPVLKVGTELSGKLSTTTQAAQNLYERHKKTQVVAFGTTLTKAEKPTHPPLDSLNRASDSIGVVNRDTLTVPPAPLPPVEEEREDSSSSALAELEQVPSPVDGSSSQSVDLLPSDRPHSPSSSVVEPEEYLPRVELRTGLTRLEHPLPNPPQAPLSARSFNESSSSSDEPLSAPIQRESSSSSAEPLLRAPLPDLSVAIPLPVPSEPRVLPPIPNQKDSRSVQESEDAEKTIARDSEVLIGKLEKLGTLKALFWICGIKDDKRPNQDVDVATLLPLVEMAGAQSNTHTSTQGKRITLWDIFIQKTQLHWTEARWWKAKLFYWFAYSWTSLIPNTTRVYAKAIIEGIQQQFKDKESNDSQGRKRADFVHNIIQNADQYLEGNYKAHKKYAGLEPSENLLNPGNLDDFKFREVASYYGHRPQDGNSLKQSKAFQKLCANFGEALLQRYVSSVPFFVSWKKQPILGKIIQAPVISWPFQFIEWALNKVIRYTVRKYVLPFSVHSVVTGGIDQATPYNNHLAIQFYRFFESLFVDLREDFAKQPTTGPSKPLAGTEKLPDLALKLKRALDLAKQERDEVGQDSLYFQMRLQELERKQKEMHQKIQSGQSDLDLQVEQAITKGIQDSLQAVFQFLSDPKKTNKLLALSLQLANNCLSTQIQTSAEPAVSLRAAGQEIDDPVAVAKEGLIQRAESFLDLVIESAVKSKVVGNPEKEQLVAQGMIEAQRKEEQLLYPAVHGWCQNIRKKLESDESEGPSASILPEIVAISQRSDALVQKIKRELGNPELVGVAKEGVERVFAPICERLALFMNKIENLMKEEYNYSSKGKTTEELQQIQQNLQEIQDLFSREQPGGVATACQKADKVFSHLEASCANIAEHISSQKQGKEEFIQALQREIQILKKAIEDIAKEQRILTLLERLGSISSANPFQPQPLLGLLQELASFVYRDNHFPIRAGRTRAQCMDEIYTLVNTKENGEFILGDDRQAIYHLLTQFTNAEEVRTKPFALAWKKLEVGLQTIYEKHVAKQNDQILKLPSISLTAFQNWIDRSIRDYTARRTESHQTMLRTIDEAQQAFEEFTHFMRNAQLEQQIHLSPEHYSVAGKILGGILGGIIAPPVGAFVGKMASTSTENAARIAQNPRPALAKGVAIASVAAGATYALGRMHPLLGMAAGGYAAYKGLGQAGAELQQTALHVGTDLVRPKVREVLHTALRLPFSDHMYHAAATRIMEDVIASTL